MNFQFLVTTDVNRVKNFRETHQVVMVDGTVPGWSPEGDDLHFDHHRDGGADTQIEEISAIGFKLSNDVIFVTTQIDADACVAAAWIIGLSTMRAPTIESALKLQAIASDCDHLTVPQHLSEYADFAAAAVAALKSNSDKLVSELGLVSDRKAWSKEDKELFATGAFRQGTIALLEAIEGKAKYPGESGEADEHLNNLKSQVKTWEKNGLIYHYNNVLIFDCTSQQGYLDPRVTLQAANNLGMITEKPFTVTQRKIVNGKNFLGYSYTIGVVPLHKNIKSVDYTKNAFVALTYAELQNNPYHYDEAVKAVNLSDEYEGIEFAKRASWLCSPKIKLGWGGRKTVGGSAWNTPSWLSPQKVANIISG